MGIPRRHSLFWTLGGSFLLVLLLAVLLQWIVAALLVEPGLRRFQQARAQVLAEAAASRVRDALLASDPAAVPEILAASGQRIEPIVLAFRGEDGRWVGGRPLSQGWRRRLEMARRFGDEPITDRPPPPRPRRDPAEGRGPGFDLEVLARAPVGAGERTLGEVYVVQPRPRVRLLALLPRQTVIYLPVAVIVAAIASLLISHRWQRRIARLEHLAARLGEGELDARVTEPGRDEIGRLGAGLNEMAGNLERARDAVRTMEEQRRQFLADVSHDLATPLTSIRGFAETLLDPEVPASPEQRERYLRSILDGAERMDRLLGDLVELSRLETQGLELERERLDFASLARYSVERFAPDFERAGLALRWTGTEAPMEVDADGRRLEQVLDNLLSNALRHAAGQGGGTEVTVAVGQEGDRAVLEVVDDGPGIAPEDLPRLFDRFYRGDRSRSTPGSGLGLAIVQEILHRHGGDITAERRTPQGARFRAWIPRATAEG